MDIPPTIESCGGSLHSEDDDDFGRDSTEGNLYSDGELDNGEMNASHKHNEIDDNRKSDKKWRGLVTLMLMGNAIIIVGSTYGFLANQETRDFYASVRYLHVLCLCLLCLCLFDCVRRQVGSLTLSIYLLYNIV